MKTPERTQNVMRYSGLAFEMLVMLGIAVWVGMIVDGKLKWKVPLFTILFPLSSLVFSLWRIIKEFSKPKE